MGEIVRLNIGGMRFYTTKPTLCPPTTRNFFTALLDNDLPSLLDETGAYFIDRDGRYFEPILRFLRTGDIYIPCDLDVSSLLHEAEFYCIDILDALNPFKEGLYLLSGGGSRSWLLFIEKDVVNFPLEVGITALFDNKVILQSVCPIERKAKNSIKVKVDSVDYLITRHSTQENAIFIHQEGKWEAPHELLWVCKASKDFSLPLNTHYLYQRKAEEGKQRVRVWFCESDEGDHLMKIQVDQSPSVSWVRVEPLTKNLLLLSNSLRKIGLVNLSGAVVFLVEYDHEGVWKRYALEQIESASTD